MFLHVSVILFTGRRLPQCMLGYQPPAPHEQTPLRADPPSGSKHPLGADTPQEQTPPTAAVHAGRYGQQAGGTHPTGMHPCLFCFQYILFC